MDSLTVENSEAKEPNGAWWWKAQKVEEHDSTSSKWVLHINEQKGYKRKLKQKRNCPEKKHSGTFRHAVDLKSYTEPINLGKIEWYSFGGFLLTAA